MATPNNPLYRLANRILETVRGWHRTHPNSPPVIDIIQLEERIFYSASPFAMLDSTVDADSISPEQLEYVESLLGDLLQSGLVEPPSLTSEAAPDTQAIPEGFAAVVDNPSSIPSDDISTLLDTNFDPEPPLADSALESLDQLLSHLEAGSSTNFESSMASQDPLDLRDTPSEVANSLDSTTQEILFLQSGLHDVDAITADLQHNASVKWSRFDHRHAR